MWKQLGPRGESGVRRKESHHQGQRGHWGTETAPAPQGHAPPSILLTPRAAAAAVSVIQGSSVPLSPHGSKVTLPHCSSVPLLLLDSSSSSSPPPLLRRTPSPVRPERGQSRHRPLVGTTPCWESGY
ncbi:hypothetical protein ACOMHN_008137 [Nucella lapillus]